MDPTTNSDGNFIDISDLDLLGGKNDAWKTLKDRIMTAVTGSDGLDIASNNAANETGWLVSTENKGTNNQNDFVLTAVTIPKGYAANAFKDPQHFENDGAFSVDFKPGVVDANPGQGAHAKAVYTLGSLAAGDKITIGDKTIELIANHDPNLTQDELDKEKASGKLTVAEFKDAATLNQTLQSMGYKDGRVSFIGSNKIAVEKSLADNTTAEAWSKGLGKVSVTKAEDSAAADEVLSDGKGLTLQIGDTADTFNQLKVAIGDMHTKALGIDGLDISNIEGAQAAIQTIKDAINNVSSVRGDLGAIQNRLEHTQNNLSVMAENIQDAESTIRDTDVAEEMMKYTKNNILIQSAQAMLAQANAVPQGVLQLLG
ncbi:MAG: hypothetical protein HFG05_05875 [Oscillibacter sp.]|nr:hypothetical protein [Oscillibacter sp.]